jgi:hypothetical protein
VVFLTHAADYTDKNVCLVSTPRKYKRGNLRIVQNRYYLQHFGFSCRKRHAEARENLGLCQKEA